MTTKNPRINVSFDTKTIGLLSELAEKESNSLASLIRELALEALKDREDRCLSKIAEGIDQPGAERCDHDDVWK